MARQTPVERAAASQGRLAARHNTATTNLNNRTNNARNNLNARDSRMLNQLVGDLTDLGPELPPPTLRKEEPRGPIPAARGYAERSFQQGVSEEGTAGIASPLTEGAGDGVALARTYHPPQTMHSSDGLFFWEIAPVASIEFRDANGAVAEFRLAIPEEPDP